MNWRAYGRIKYKQWRNGRGGRWTCRITWYCKRRDDDQRTMYDIRLRMETEEREWNEYPATLQEADRLWDKFKEDHPRLMPGEFEKHMERRRGQ